MLTKFILYIEDEEYELKEDDIRNWGDIQCSYKRADYDGLVRSFTSMFEFVNRARDLLMSAYLRDGFNINTSISVLVSDDHWLYEEKFRCPLDFSTISWDSFSLKLNCVDNSLEALIKANKSTKYEFEIGNDIIPDGKFLFDRIPMMENIVYEFTQGTQFDDCADIVVDFEQDTLPYLGNTTSEISVNGMIEWNDDQTNDLTSYLFKAVKDVKVKLNTQLVFRRDEGFGYGVRLYAHVRKGGIINSGEILIAELINAKRIGDYSDPSELPSPDNSINNDNSYAVVAGITWILKYGPGGYTWLNTGKTPKDYFSETISTSTEFDLQAGDKVYISNFIINPADESVSVRFITSSLQFDWKSIGESVDIDVFSVRRIVDTLLKRLAGDNIKVNSFISGHDPRLSDTWLMAAESARGLNGARFYSSFNEFCEWMATVFGYVYYIGDPLPPKYTKTQEVGQYVGTPWQYVGGFFQGDPNPANIVYIPQHARFLYHYHSETEDILYTHWLGCDNYNDAVDGHPRTDTLFRILPLGEDNLYFFEKYNGTSLYPTLYDHSDDYIGDDGKTVYFVHRSELFSNTSVRKMYGCKGFQYTVDSGIIYSSVTSGYEQKDYENINGRDEFNFNNTYTTGCTASDKTLSLMSKYRADCYGIEFVVQKRGQATTDSTSDKDVFFVLCSGKKDELVADRSIEIKNALSERVFNGAFSPMACVRANAGLIGLQADEMTLSFASSTGNSEIIIADEPISADIHLSTPIATCGTIEFSTDDVEEIANLEEIVEVEDDGIIYRGYLKEVDIKYTRTEAAKYKLIVKEIEI